MRAHTNWIADQNRFGLASPPAWWLQRLHDYDSQLVVVPSRQDALYRICRRKQFSKGFTVAALVDTQRDTAMMAHYGLVPVTTMIRYSQAWDIDTILLKLDERDMWRISGGPMSGRSAQERADRVADAIEKHENDQDTRERERVRGDLDYRGKDAWRSYQARTGQRSRPNTSGGKSTPSGSTPPAAIKGSSNRIILASA